MNGYWMDEEKAQKELVTDYEECLEEQGSITNLLFNFTVFSQVC